VTAAELERVLRHVALPPLRLGIRVKRLEARRVDPVATALADQERATTLATLIRTRLARAGWWN
jgi:hypothetical protein